MKDRTYIAIDLKSFYASVECRERSLEDDPSDVEVQAVHQKLLQCLAQNDPFWPRWIYFAEQHGVTL